MNYNCQHQGHAIPTNDSEEHTPNDFCPCKPEMAQGPFGSFWRHNCFNFQDLIESAEHIRMIISVQLQRDLVLNQPKCKGLDGKLCDWKPFPAIQLSWPQHNDRQPKC